MGDPHAHELRRSQLAALAADTLPEVAPARAAWFIRLQAYSPTPRLPA